MVLESSQCVISCPPSSPFPVISPRLKYCRGQDHKMVTVIGFSYYVDPSSSTSNIELGTRAMPFKSIDDPFREILNFILLNQGGVLSEEITIYLKAGANITVYSGELPLIIVNSKISIRPYPDDSSWASIKFSNDQYKRPLSNFNPTLDSSGNLIPYDYMTLVAKGVLSAGFLVADRTKIVSFNSSIRVTRINHYEPVIYYSSTTVAIYSVHLAPFKWAIFEECLFDVATRSIYSSNGANFKLLNSLFNVTNSLQVSLSEYSADCQQYLPENTGMSNNFIFENNTFFGTSNSINLPIIQVQNHANVTISNNIFKGFSQSYGKSIQIEHFKIGCPYIFTETIFERNKVITDHQSYSNIQMLLAFSSEGMDSALIRNNTFKGQKLTRPIFQIFKPSGTNLSVIFEGNTFESISSTLSGMGILQVTGQNVSILSNTLKNSKVGYFLSVQAQQGLIKGTTLVDVSQSSDSQVYSGSGFLTVQSSQNLEIVDISFSYCSFDYCNALLIQQSASISIRNFSARDCKAESTDLIVLNQVQDLKVDMVDVNGTMSLSNGQSSIFLFSQIMPKQNQNETMVYDLSNFRIISNQVSFMTIESFAKVSNANPVIFRLRNALIQNNTLANKNSILVFKSFFYEGLVANLSNIIFLNNSVEVGFLISIMHSSNLMSISNCFFISNQGILSSMQSEEHLNVAIESSVFYNNSAQEALFQSKSKVHLSIRNATFEDNKSFGRGCILFVDSSSFTEVKDSLFRRNSGIFGGVFFAQLNGTIAVVNSSFFSSIAYQGGVMYQQSEGGARFTNCTFRRNLAYEGSILYSINSQNPISISGGLITKNGVWYRDSQQKNDLAIAIFPNIPVLQNMIRFNPTQELEEYFFRTTYIDRQFYIIKAILTLDSGLVIMNQYSLIKQTSGSTTYINGIIYKDTQSQQSLILSESSIVSFRDLTFSNVSCQTHMIEVLSGSQGSLDNVLVLNSKGSMVATITSTLSISRLSTNLTVVDRSSLNDSFIYSQASVLHFKDVDIKNFIALDKVTPPPIMYLRQSQVDIESGRVSSFDSQFISADGDSDITITSLVVEENRWHQTYLSTGGALSIRQSSLFVQNSVFRRLTAPVGSAITFSDLSTSNHLSNLTVQNSSFERNIALVKGGAIFVLETDYVLIQNSNFTSNVALQENAGAVYLSSSRDIRMRKSLQSTLLDQNHSIRGSTFSFNSANLSGGAIYYDLISPTGLVENVFKNNDAIYGKNYGSYPFKLSVLSYQNTSNTLNSIVSGVQITQSIKVGVYDQEGQLVTLDNTSIGWLTSSDLSLQISGNNKKIAEQGVYMFDSITFVAEPMYKTSITLVSTALDQSKIQFLTGSPPKPLSVDLQFRSCISGEINVENKCQKCVKDSFSFDPTDLACRPCIQNAQCLGGTVIHTAPSYWRASNQSLITYLCPIQKSCLQGYLFFTCRGGIDSTCAKGYTGLLCNVCSKTFVGNSVYGKIGSGECSVCPQMIIQIFYIIIVVVGVYFYMLVLLKSLFSNPSRNKPQTVLIRILTNYFQTIFIIKGFELNWPEKVKMALQVFSIIFSSLDILISFDCLYLMSGAVVVPAEGSPLPPDTGLSVYYIKVIFYALLPAILSLAVAVLLILRFICRKLKQKPQKGDLWRTIQVSTFIIIYILYPKIASLTLSLYNCTTITDGLGSKSSFLTNDMSIKCWTQKHLQYSMLIGIPLTIIYILGFPFLIFLKLYKNRQMLNDNEIVLSYGLFFVGLEDYAFFWEIVTSNFRKVIYIVAGDLLSSSNETVKVVVGVVIILLQTQIFRNYKPYIDPRFNTIEYHSQFASIFSFVSGLFFVQIDVTKSDKVLFSLFLVVLIYNLYFLCHWLKLFSEIMIRLHIKELQRSIIFRCCIRKHHIEDYTRNLKRQRKRRRLAERARKMRDTELQAAEAMMKENLDILKSHSLSRHYEEDDFNQDALPEMLGENKVSDLFQGNLNGTTSPPVSSKRQWSSRQIQVNMTPDQNTVSAYYRFQKAILLQKHNLRAKDVHQAEIVQELKNRLSSRKKWELDKNPVQSIKLEIPVMMSDCSESASERDDFRTQRSIRHRFKLEESKSKRLKKALGESPSRRTGEDKGTIDSKRANSSRVLLY